jgi:hypothetical protein
MLIQATTKKCIRILRVLYFQIFTFFFCNLDLTP